MQRIGLFIVVSYLLFIPSLIWAESGCLLCHSVMKAKIEGRKGFIVDVFVDSQRFSGSVHGDIECTECHLTYTTLPHDLSKEQVPSDVSGLLPYTSQKSKSDPVALSACVRCHAKAYTALRESVHGENIFKKKNSDGPLCLDCHGSPHYIVPAEDKESPVNHANVLHTCGFCHEKNEIIEKYNLSAHVIEKYKESFHGKKYILGHKKVPICNDCHGSHNITKWDADDSPVSGSAKVKTCGRCHKGATEKFASAPSHKYIGKENPIPYYGEKLLILLVFGVFGFTISHVVLEAYSELRDKLLRRKEEEHDE
ncbi:MAG: hypothetical protein HY805_10725 [Nitrospirae bacterium]|nr:hypothetical protein [Nitrospirota bacterium]